MLGSRPDFTGDLRGKISDYKSTSVCVYILEDMFAFFFFYSEKFTYSLLKYFNLFSRYSNSNDKVTKIIRYKLD